MLEQNEQETNANLAAALGSTVEELKLDAPPEVNEILEAPGESDEAAEVDMDEEVGEPAEDEQPEPDDTAQDGTEEDETPQETMEYAESTTIKAALAGDGLPQELIEALTPDQLRSYMAKRSDRDAAFDRLRDKANATKSPDDAGAEKADDGGASQEPDNPVSQADLTALTEEFGEDGAKLIAGFMQSQTTAKVEEATRPLLTAIGGMIEAAQRSRLSGMVPDDLGEGWYETVQARAMELGGAGMYSDKPGTQRQDALFDAALRLEYPDIPGPTEIARETKRAKQRRNGSPSSPGGLPRARKGLTKAEAMDGRARAAIDGKSVEEIHRMFPI